jgi:hypothetical protein
METKITLTLKNSKGETLFYEVFTFTHPWDHAIKQATITSSDEYMEAFAACSLIIYYMENGSRVVERVWHKKPVALMHPFDDPALLLRAEQKKFTAKHMRLLRLLDSYSAAKARAMMGISNAGVKKALERIYSLFTDSDTHTLSSGNFRYREVIYWLKYGELMPEEAAV